MSKSNQVIDFKKKRTERIDEKRRTNQRVFFKKLLGIYCVSEGEGMRPLELVDVSEDGLSFQIAFDKDHPWPSDEREPVLIRIYFSQDTYIPLSLKIQNSRSLVEEGNEFIRYGCAIDQSLTSYPVFQQFVKFLEMYAEHSHKEEGGRTLFYL